MAHFMPYWFGDSLEANVRAAAEHWRMIDRNMHATSDYVAVAKHWGEPGHAGDDYTHLWTGGFDKAGRGVGTLVPDPTPARTIAQRTWAEVSRLTDATGTRRIRTIAELAQDGVRRNVIQVPEPKGSPLLDVPEFWRRLGIQLDAVGHPRVAMTLSDIGSPLRRIRAAHAVTPPFKIAVLPRGEKRPDLIAEADAVWGTAWGT